MIWMKLRDKAEDGTELQNLVEKIGDLLARWTILLSHQQKPIDDDEFAFLTK